jgi:hypothetical protein
VTATTGTNGATASQNPTAQPGPTPLEIYLDRGPLGRAIGRLAPARVPAALLAALAGAPLAVAWIVRGTELPDGLLVGLLGWAVVLGSLAGARTAGRLGWLVPPIIRGVEYGSLIYLAAAAHTAHTAAGSGPAADAGGPLTGALLGIAFLLLAVLAFRHYDAVYRLQFQKVPPPAWLGVLGGGWELRLLVALGLFLSGMLAPGYLAAALVLGAVFVTESVLSWQRLNRSTGPLGPEHSDDDREE